MNYYEYAPPIFRWIFGNTEIKPWEMFPWFWRFFLFFSVGFIIFGCVMLIKNKNKIINVTLLFMGIMGLGVTPFLDKFYLDYEWRTALSQPGFYINKQVKADNYVDVEVYYTKIEPKKREQFLILSSLKIDERKYKPADFKTKDEFCSIHELGPYHFIEKGYIHDRGDQNQLAITGKSLDNPNRINKEDYNSYGIYYTEKRDNGCFEGTRERIQSRYYVMREEQMRVGLGLARKRTIVVDSQTGDTLGYANYFYTDRNILFKLTLGLLDNVLPHGNNPKVTSMHNAQIIEYMTESSRYEISERALIRYVLIPTHYYENPEGDVL